MRTRLGISNFKIISSDIVHKKIYKLSSKEHNAEMIDIDAWAATRRETLYKGEVIYHHNLDSSIPEFNQIKNMYLFGKKSVGKNLSSYINLIEKAYHLGGYDFALPFFLNLYRDPVIVLWMILSGESTFGMTMLFMKKMIFLDSHCYYSMFSEWETLYSRSAYYLWSNRDLFISESDSFFNFANLYFLKMLNVTFAQVINDNNRLEMTQYKKYLHHSINEDISTERLESDMYKEGLFSEIIDIDEEKEQLFEFLTNDGVVKSFCWDS
jgi:hypothetical protein